MTTTVLLESLDYKDLFKILVGKLYEKLEELIKVEMLEWLIQQW